MGHRYLLTHGDQFRDGDGMIARCPIIRGDHRQRSRNNQIDMAYDTMLLGHRQLHLGLRATIDRHRQRNVRSSTVTTAEDRGL